MLQQNFETLRAAGAVEAMRVLVAPGPYKECLPAEKVAEYIARGIERVLPTAHLTKLPLSDGGTGLTKRLTDATGGKIIPYRVTGPIGQPVDAFYGVLGDGRTAVIESAAAAGLSLVPPKQRKPLWTTTYGVGELIYAAIQKGYTRIIVGCGDSATTDGGIGMAQALGIRFYDRDDEGVPGGGGHLADIRQIDFSGLKVSLSDLEIITACNFSSILCGPEGTANVYARQKGASNTEVLLLNRGLENYAAILKRACGVDVQFMPGAGGAGGLAAGLHALLGATLRPSFDVVAEFVHLDSYLELTELIITGEGTIDARTATGKLPCALARRAKKYNIPVVAIVGTIADDADVVYEHGIDVVESIITKTLTLEQAIAHAPELITAAATRVMHSIQCFGVWQSKSLSSTAKWNKSEEEVLQNEAHKVSTINFSN